MLCVVCLCIVLNVSENKISRIDGLSTLTQLKGKALPLFQHPIIVSHTFSVFLTLLCLLACLALMLKGNKIEEIEGLGSLKELNTLGMPIPFLFLLINNDVYSTKTSFYVYIYNSSCSAFQ